MGTHLIPREIDGDGRILIIFTPAGFVGTLIGIGVGAILYSICEMFNAVMVGWIILGICALIGFIIGQVKIPDSNSFPLFKKIGGEYIRDIIVEYFNFQKNKKIYLYDQTEYEKKTEEETEGNPLEELSLLNFTKKN